MAFTSLGYKLEVITKEVTINALAASGTITVDTIKKGTKIHEVVIDFPNLGASTALKFGDAVDDDRFVTSTATTAAGNVRLNAPYAATTGRSYEYTADTALLLTNSGASGTTASNLVVLVTMTVERTFD